ncbi:MAG: hypothetical protein LQ344_001015 [Seirophora lacunosa]|nr:MAG: hypothetical protein LQ344_001015 [Seirophora lacunosa]
MAAHSPPEQVVKTLHINPPISVPAEAFDTPNGWTDTFWEYPEEQSWSANDGQSQWFLCSQPEAAERAQSWFYLHLLNSILGVRVPTHTISRLSTKSGKPILDSSLLPQLLQDWESRIRQQRQGGQAGEDGDCSDKKHFDKVLALLKKILGECNKLDERSEPSRSVSFSIKILIETLTTRVCRITKNNAAAQWKLWRLGPTPLLEERMACAGWCRFQIATLRYQHLPSTVYYLSSLPHRTTFGGSTHSDCTPDQCTSAGVDPTTYEPRHRKTCMPDRRDCSMIGVDTARVAEIVLQGSIPLIEIRLQLDGAVALDVVPHNSSLRYVAISHVWSGGLGNARANAMRTCQLKYLQGLLLRLRENGDDDLDRRQGCRKIQDSADDIRFKWGFERQKMPLYLWIDTLCIPVGDPYNAAKTQTLNRMAQLYIAAQCVLVLDPELPEIHHRAMRKEQTFAHIMCSSWMSRSWTFQEACMARIWFVQFADGYFTVDKKYFEFQKASEKLDEDIEDVNPIATTSCNFPAVSDMSEPQIRLMDDVSYWFREMPVIAKIRNRDPRELMNKLEDWKNFALAWNGLRNRSTTKPEDLFGILAVVVDLSAGEILKLPQENRLKAILRSQSTLPLPLLYQSSPKLLNENGVDTWAPSAIRGNRLDLHSGYVSLNPKGLLLDPGKWAQLSTPQAILVDSCPVSSWFLHVSIGQTQTVYMVELLLTGTSPIPDSPVCSLCFIFHNDLTINDNEIGTFTSGACVFIHSLTQQTYQASYRCPIRVFATQNTSPHSYGPSVKKAGTLPASLSVSGSVIDWQGHSIFIDSDFSAWPAPSPHVSKRSGSKLVVIRNASVWCQLSYNALAHGPYLIAFSIYFTRRQNPTARQLAWLFLSRWLCLAAESVWEGAILVVWDHRRAVRWSNRLYGTFTKSRSRRLKSLTQYPMILFKVLLLTAALVFTALYCSHRQSWMKISAIVLFCDTGLSSAYVSLLIYLIFKYAKGQYRPFTINVFTNLPEDPFEYSDSTLQFWEEETRIDVDHRYPIAVLGWRIVECIRRRGRAVDQADRMDPGPRSLSV